MNTPLIEQIAEAIKTVVAALEGLTVLRPRRVFWDKEVTADNTVVIMQESPEKLQSTIVTQDWRQPFLIRAVCLDSDAADVPIDTRLNLMRSLVEKALLEDTSLGGLALDLKIEPPTLFESESLTGVEIVCQVDYRTQYNDPFTQA